jgi:hypothetical protein
MVFVLAIMLLLWGGFGVWTREMVLLFKPTNTTLRLTKWRSIVGGLLCIATAIILMMVLFSSQNITVHFVGCALNMIYFVPGMVLLYIAQYYGFDSREEKEKRKAKE